MSTTNTKVKVSVGIPAYNEEANIGFLLRNVLSQKEINFEIYRIIVVSDGSTDNTVKIANDIYDERIQIIDHKDRKGKSFRQNEIIENGKGTYIVILDADILIEDSEFLAKLIAPILEDNKIGLTAANAKVVKPETYIERVLAYSIQMKEQIYNQINNSNNVYYCRGSARAFSVEFTKNLIWKNVGGGEDAYSYLTCIKNNFSFIYVEKAILYYRLPQTFHDYIKQSTRFFSNRKNLKNIFGNKLVNDSFNIPKKVVYPIIIKYFFKNPFYFLSYGVLIFSSKFRSKKVKDKATWDQIQSSKQLIRNS